MVGFAVFRDPLLVLALIQNRQNDNKSRISKYARPDQSFRLRAYDEIVYRYSDRELSYQSDALNAVCGVLRRLTVPGMYPRGFFWDLPREDLPTSLTWISGEGAVRRQGFPSWSWLGWRGGITRGSRPPTTGSAPLDPDDLIPTLIFRGAGAVQRIHDPNSRDIIRNIRPPDIEQYGLGPTELASLLIVLGWVVPCRIPWFEARSMPQGWEFSALWGDYHVHIICYTADTKRRLQVAAEETRFIWMLQLQCFQQMTIFGCDDCSHDTEARIELGREFLFMLLDGWDDRPTGDFSHSDPVYLKPASRADLVTVVGDLDVDVSLVFKDARYEHVLLL